MPRDRPRAFYRGLPPRCSVSTNSGGKAPCLSWVTYAIRVTLPTLTADRVFGRLLKQLQQKPHRTPPFFVALADSKATGRIGLERWRRKHCGVLGRFGGLARRLDCCPKADGLPPIQLTRHYGSVRQMVITMRDFRISCKLNFSGFADGHFHFLRPPPDGHRIPKLSALPTWRVPAAQAVRNNRPHREESRLVRYK